MRVSAKADYGVRAMLELARTPGDLTTAEFISQSQDIPVKFLRGTVLPDLRRAGLVTSARGPDGGHRLARPAGQISVGDVIRGLDGPLTWVNGEPPEEVRYLEHTEILRDVWIAMDAGLREVLDRITLDHLVRNRLPENARHLLAVRRR